MALNEKDELIKTQTAEMENMKAQLSENNEATGEQTKKIDQLTRDLEQIKQQAEEADKARKEEQDQEFWKLVRQVADMRTKLDAKDAELNEALKSAQDSNKKQVEIEGLKSQLTKLTDECDSKVALKEKEVREALEASIGQMTEAHKQ